MRRQMEYDMVMRVSHSKIFRGLLKKAASGVLAIFPCSRTYGTLRAKKKTVALLDELFYRPPSF